MLPTGLLQITHNHYTLILGFWLLVCHYAYGQEPADKLPAVASPRAAQVEQLIRQRIPLLQLDGMNCLTFHQTTSRAGHHFQLYQTYRGHIVYGTFIKATIDHTGMLSSLHPQLSKWAAIQNEVRFSFDTCQTRVTALAGGKTTRADTLLVPDSTGNAAWFYRFVTTEDRLTGSNEFLFNAQTGELIYQFDRCTYYSRCAGHGSSARMTFIDTLAQGYVHLPDPITTAETEYGGPWFWDNNNQTSPVLNAQRRVVNLAPISFNAELGLFELRNRFIRIADIQPPTIPPTVSENNLFLFDRSEDGFEDVNAFYHANAFQHYVFSVGFDSLFIPNLRIDTHGRISDNSLFVGNPQGSYIIFGIGGVDDAEDGAVVVHEFGHALSYAASPGTNLGLERRGLDEGLCDYFAASYTRRLSEYRWQDLFKWDGHNEFWPGRTATRPQSYTQIQSASPSIYTYGEVWNSALMRIWERIGASACDQLVLQTLYSLVPNQSLRDAAYAMLAADTLLFGGIYHSTIACTFCETELLPDSICQYLTCTSSRNLPKTRSNLGLHPNPTRGRIVLSVPTGTSLAGWWRIRNLLGQTVFKWHESDRNGQESHVELPAGLPAGWYELQHEQIPDLRGSFQLLPH